MPSEVQHVASASQLAPAPSIAIVAGGSALLLVAALFARWRAHGFERRARRIETLGDARGDPTWTAVTGTLVTDGDEGARVCLRLVETLDRDDDDRSWRTIERTVIARPFSVQLDDGTRVRVEPDARARVWMTATSERMVRAGIRHRDAVLAAGARVTVVGTRGEGIDPQAHGEGYRGSPRGTVIRAGAGRPMVISARSLEALAAEERDDAGWFRRRSKMFAGVLVASHVLFFWQFDALHLAGVSTVATVIDGRAEGVRRTGGDGVGAALPYYFVTAEFVDARSQRWVRGEAQVEATSYYALRYRHFEGVRGAGLGDQVRAAYDLRRPIERRVDWCYVPGAGTVIQQIGAVPTLHGALAVAFAALVLSLSFSLGVPRMRRRERFNPV